MPNLIGIVVPDDPYRHTPPQPSILDQFPEYDFIPAAPLMRRKKRVFLIIRQLAFIPAIISGIVAGYWFAAWLLSGSEDQLMNCIYGWLSVLPSVLFGCSIDALTERHISNYRNMKIVIPPTYDCIKWKKPNMYITVTSGTRTEIRDTDNKICL